MNPALSGIVDDKSGPECRGVAWRQEVQPPNAAPWRASQRACQLGFQLTKKGMTQLEVLRTSARCEMSAHLTIGVGSHLTIDRPELPSGQLQLCHTFSRGQIMR